MTNPTKEANCRVLGDGCGVGDHDHVAMSTPMDVKRQEFKDSPRFDGKAIDRARERATTKERRFGDVRPLGGNK
jgi:hypothetical protein